MDFIFDPSLVLYLPLYQLDGASFTSKDAYGHLCTVTGALWRPQGREFDYVDDSIQFDLPTSLKTANVTYLAWAKPDILNAQQAVAGAVPKGAGATGKGWELIINNTGKVLALKGDGGGSWISLAGNTSLAVSAWSFIGDTFDGAKMAVYLNGALDCTPYAHGTAISWNESGDGPNPSQFYISGIRDNTAGTAPNLWLYDGVIGEVWVYSRALTPLEIQHNYQVTKWRYR